MSSSEDITGGATSSQCYFCHRCEGPVTIVLPIDADPVCPICGGSFVEEVEYPESNLNPTRTRSSFFSNHVGSLDPLLATASGLLFDSYPGSVEIRNSGDFASLLGLDSTPFHSQPSDNPGFDPQLFVHNYIQSIFSGGASIQVIFDGDGGGGSTFISNIGDYLFGSGLEHIVHQLFENDPNRYGPPPAAKSAVEALPVIQISEEMFEGNDEGLCAVCKDAFEVGAEAMQIPCRHVYHKDCIVPWLELHNSCPMCRYELPTDDPDYVQGVMGAPAAAGGRPEGTGDFGVILASEAGDEQRPSGRGTMQRRVRISLPWPLRDFGAQRSGNTSGVSDDSSSNASLDENFEGLQINDPRHDDWTGR